MDEREGIVEIDLSEVQTSIELHKILKEKLSFPSFYGMNWDAFWDSITGLVEMPLVLKIIGWSRLQKVLPRDSRILMESLDNLNKKHPSWACQVYYID
ncbi:barstar family protein [Paenibacillus sp. TAF58]